jgi:putative FmdB family regulatory protein
MPLYDFKCLSCGKEFESFKKVAEKDLQRCEEQDCRGKTKTLITQNGGFRYEDGYDSDLGENITGPAQRAKIMKDRGLEVVHKSEIQRLRPPKKEKDTLHKAHLRARAKGAFSLGELY